MKRVLSIHYTQSGQLTEITDNFCAGLENVEIDSVRIYPAAKFPFPWNGPDFFNTMPETVMENEIELEPFSFKYESYDLIILAYQPWFLSPSLPFTSLLKSDKLKMRMNNTPVVTIIGSRNMWMNSQESVKKLIHDAGGKLIGNVPLIDKTTNLVSVVTILHWMLTGQKTKKWGIFPKPGVSDQDILNVKKFGELLSDAMKNSTLEHYQKEVVANNGVIIPTNILFIEGRAKKLFIIWAKLIQKKERDGKNRKFWVNFFKYYLIFALFVVSPILLFLYTILIVPFTLKSIRDKKNYFRGVELK